MPNNLQASVLNCMGVNGFHAKAAIVGYRLVRILIDVTPFAHACALVNFTAEKATGLAIWFQVDAWGQFTQNHSAWPMA